jgi:hypothetical protein
MDARKLVELVQQAQADSMDYFRLAAIIAEEQKQEDANLAETMGATSVAAAIRGV